nr:hypothetical protein [Tanacetum cinerariifolium]
MMVLMRQTVSCDMLDHMVMTDKTLLVVKTETADTLADDVDTVFCSTDVGRSKQVGQKFVHSSIEPHWHDIRVDLDIHEVDRRSVPAFRSVPVTRSAPVTRSSPVTRSAHVTRSAPVTRSGLVTSSGPVTRSGPLLYYGTTDTLRVSYTRVDDEEADVQRALEESLKRMYDVPRGPLPPVVIREPESEKYRPLPEVPGKGKEKVIEKQVARDLLNLQMPKKNSPIDRYIFQRRTSTPTRSSGHDESSSSNVELGLTDSEEESKEDVPGADARGQGEGQAGPDPDAKDEGQARSNPDEQVEGQAGPDPVNVEASQPIPSYVVHAGSDHEHIDLDVADVSTQPPPEQMDEGLLQRLIRRFKRNSSSRLKNSDKPSKADNDKATAETKAESMIPESPEMHQLLKATATKTTTTTITTTILPPPSQQQQSTTDAMMMKRIDELEHIMADLIQENKRLEQRLDSHRARLYTLEQLDIPHQVCKAIDEVVMDAVDWAMQAPLRNRFRDLPEAYMKEILHQLMWETDSYKSHEDHMQLYEALEKSMNRPSRASGSPGASGSSQVPPPPPSTNQEEERPATLEPAWLIPSSDVPVLTNNWASALASNYSPPPEDSLLAQTCDIAMFMDYVDDSILRHNVSKPLPLGGPPGQVIIQSDFFFNKDLEYLRYGSKGSKPALSISKMKAAYYPDVGLEQMVPDQMWIEEEYKYDIVAMYGISHWWFQRQRFYIDRHTSEGDRRAVRTHMRILSVVRIEFFSMYGYDYMKKIVLRRADLNEHVIAE